jgi:hypothetical protein
MKTLTIPILLLLAVLPATAQQVQQPICPGNALCPQQTTTTDHTVTPSAPVGHRQPTMNNLTPQVRHDETTGSGAPDPLGPLPKICRDC